MVRQAGRLSCNILVALLLRRLAVLGQPNKRMEPTCYSGAQLMVAGVPYVDLYRSNAASAEGRPVRGPNGPRKHQSRDPHIRIRAVKVSSLAS